MLECFMLEASESSPETRGLDGRVALVTGGSVGIGAATARALAAHGCRVALTYRARKDEAEEVAREIGGRAYALELGERDQVVALARRVEEEFGTVEILVHNAGMIKDALLPFLSEGDWDRVQAVNLKGPYLLTKALIKGMLAQKWGRVISIASASGIIGQIGQTHYSASKGGLIAFTKALAREVARYRVTANAIAPGFIDTEILADIPERKMAQYLESIPLGRLGRPEEVAELVAYVASEPAGYMTGQVLRLDGGLILA